MPGLPVGLTVIGLLFAIGGLVFVIRDRRRKREWLRVPGEVYDVVSGSGSSTNPTYHWMFRCTGPDGVQREHRNPYGTTGGRLRSFPFPIEVLVDPNNPERAQVASGHTGTRVGVMFMVFGVIAVLAGVGILGLP